MTVYLASAPMDQWLSETLQFGFRWIHVIAGVLWIGILWFFNWVNGAFTATLDGDTKKKVVPELMPRALFWFRWGAAYTWITGVLLLGLLYYMGGGNLLDPMNERSGAQPELMEWLPAFLGLFVGFVVYDQLFKTLGKNSHEAAVVVWGVLAVGFACVLDFVLDYSGRATLIHVGALFGTSMAANVWMRIWPAQKRIITAIKNGQAPDPADPALAGLRSKHNTYMSVPLLLFMVSVHQTYFIGLDPHWVVLVTLVLGFGITWGIYKKVPSVKGF